MLQKDELSPNGMYPLLPLSQSKAISPRGRFENSQASQASQADFPKILKSSGSLVRNLFLPA